MAKKAGETTQDNDFVADPNAVAAAAAVANSADKPKTPDELDRAALAAFDQGVAVAEGKPATARPTDSEDAVVIDPKTGKPVEEDADADEEDDDGVDESVTPADDKAAAKPDGEKPAKAEPDAAVEKELKDLGITNANTQKRFRELSADSKQLQELRPLLDQLGIKDAAAQLPQLYKDAQRGLELDQVIDSTGANNDQLAGAFAYLYGINSGDPALMRTAYDTMAKEMEWLGKQLGIRTGSYDPLEEDPELLAQVRDGDVTRAVAERMLAAEKARKIGETRDANVRTRQTAQQVQAQGVEEVRQLGAELAAEDPENYRGKLSFLAPSIKLIQESKPPGEWKEAIRALYKATPAPPKPKKPAAEAPLRPNGATNSNTVVAKPSSDMEAFERGLSMAPGSGGGGW
jgi:hypothetical protein